MTTGKPLRYTNNHPGQLNLPIPKDGVKTTPFCGFFKIIFWSCADTINIFYVSVQRHQRHFLTYYTQPYSRQIRFFRS